MRAKKFSIVARSLNIAICTSLQAQANGPLCSGEILGLNSAQPLHYLTWLFKPSSGDTLI